MLTVFVLLIQLLSLLLPFSTVHARMVEFKRALIGRAAVMTRRRQRLRAVVEANGGWDGQARDRASEGFSDSSSRA